MMTWFGPDGAELRQRVRGLVVLILVAWATAFSAPRAALAGVGLAVTVLLAGAAGCWLFWLVRPQSRFALAATVVCGVFGDTLTLISPHSPALVLVFVALARAAYCWPVRWAAGFGFALATLYLAGRIADGDMSAWVLAGPAVMAAALGLGLLRRQNRELAAQVEQARDARARSAALDERARIAREIHDVLAHSLTALSVQLEAADALLESGRGDQAHTFLRRANQLSREGIAETRRAVEALRGDTPPLPELLDQLATAYRVDTRAAVRVEVTAPAQPLRADVALTLFRTAQEAFTNVRKHAPGAPVDVRLSPDGTGLRLSIVNGCGPAGEHPLAATGSGYGLTGLRERAELAGGALTAGPLGDGWRVEVAVPA